MNIAQMQNSSTSPAITANRSYMPSENKRIFDNVFDLLGISDGSKISERLNVLIFSADFKSYVKKYRDYTSQFDFEPIIKAYQFYSADREGKKQDFTPKFLSELLAKITIVNDDKVVLDMCAGLGMLTIGANKIYSKKYILQELDEKEIPVLLFLMCVYSVNGFVEHKDVIKDEVYATYQVSNGSITKEMFPPSEIANAVISNPPFNLKAEPKTGFLSNNTNFQFIYEAILKSDENARISFILPNGILNSGLDQKSRKWLIDENLLEAVITLPENIFDETRVMTSVLLINKRKIHEKVTFIDHSKTFDYEIIKKQGEGTNRIYSKTKNFLNNEHIHNILHILTLGVDTEISITVSNEDTVKSNYELSPWRYIPQKVVEKKTRPINDIISDLQRIMSHKNNVKLTLNETIAKQTGFDKIQEMMKQSNESQKTFNEFLEFQGLPTIPDNKYIQLTKTKNEVKFEQDKSFMSSFMEMNMPVWKHQIHFLNKEENRLLAELRDYFLPKLMSGEINVESLNINSDV